MQRRNLWTLAAVLVLVAAGPVAAQTLDKGRLDLGWFDPEAVFKEVDEIDYLWVASGFDLEGKSLHFKPWPEPQFAPGSNPDEKDRRLARMITAAMQDALKDAFAKAYGNRIEVSTEKGDILVEGRVVDCSTGSTAAKVLVGFGAGAGNTTIDVRFVDAATGKVLAGFHHRVVSGTTWSTTDSKFFNWLDDAVGEMAEKGLPKLYAKGKKVKN
ncbi:MAG TPA: DUF4410 domain-containing protein [Thermoanaerobaculaceae bacterium]|mgnify:CR=1 FL=1|nr:DUF4410 domain-containing protein [Thermoanaerobaculaceae bacterium]